MSYFSRGACAGVICTYTRKLGLRLMFHQRRSLLVEDTSTSLLLQGFEWHYEDSDVAEQLLGFTTLPSGDVIADWEGEYRRLDSVQHHLEDLFALAHGHIASFEEALSFECESHAIAEARMRQIEQELSLAQDAVITLQTQVDVSERHVDDLVRHLMEIQTKHKEEVVAARATSVTELLYSRPFINAIEVTATGHGSCYMQLFRDDLRVTNTSVIPESIRSFTPLLMVGRSRVPMLSLPPPGPSSGVPATEERGSSSTGAP
ncbi:hypothetical protein CDL15_Pgr006413 [Punica granatum]|uniref:Uncharacterized protein n=1 Tax=Punica granatum TaxID=22663 RepID=A0A218Y1I3_PUNGR|nr:hypothetical protein CDL15_Pgr006413 [Punica granatum]